MLLQKFGRDCCFQQVSWVCHFVSAFAFGHGFFVFGKTPGGVPLVHRLPPATGYFAFGKLG